MLYIPDTDALVVVDAGFDGPWMGANEQVLSRFELEV